MNSVMAWLSLTLLLMLTGSAAAQRPVVVEPQLNQPAPNESALLSAKPLKEDPKDDELRKLQKARYNEALAEVQLVYIYYQTARVPFDAVADAGPRLVRAGLEVCDNPAAKVALLKQYVDLTKRAEAMAQARFEITRGDQLSVHRARYQRLDAEIQLLRATRDADNVKKK